MDPASIAQEKEWFEQVAKGDEIVFSRLFHHYNARLFSFIKKITRSEAISEEIVQECFLRLWIHRKKVAQMEKPGAWLFLVASHLSMNHLRNAINQSVKHKAAAASTGGDPFLDPYSRLEGKELAGMVEEAVRQLPSRRREVYRLSRHEGLGHKEIAVRLGLSPNTVKDHLVIALRTIRDHIRQHSGTTLAITAFLGWLKKF